MEIVHIASEFAPLAKVGGLADAVAGLAKALVAKGHRVEVILPHYDLFAPLELREIGRLYIVEKGRSIENIVRMTHYEGVQLTLIEARHPEHYFRRGKIYGELDDNDRFLFFCKVASHMLLQRKQLPEVVHLHDWMTASVPLFLAPHRPKRLIFTIHNLNHQGKCARFNLDRLEISYDEKELADPLEPDTLNLLKGAILKSDAVAVVSPSYAKEIQTLEGGGGLGPFLARHKKKLRGILNGIDTQTWDPQTDRFLHAHYSPSTFLEGKKSNKALVQEKLGLTPNEKVPLIVAITRLVPQKGPDLIAYGIERCAQLGGQFVLLGSPAQEEIRTQFEELQRSLAGDRHIAFRFEHDEPLSHLLYGASDFLFMPSLFEPCGLAQMIAMRYGSIPLVHATGGLKDTVFDPASSEKPNGFLFQVPDNKGVSSLLERAFSFYYGPRAKWEELILNGMGADWSWEASAQKYLRLYSD